MPTVFEICRGIYEVGPSGKVAKSAHPVTDKLGPPEPLPTKPGLYTLSPEQLLSLNIPHWNLETGHGREGYQQPFRLPHARQMALAMTAGREFPTVEISLFNRVHNVTDGQNRTIGAVIAAVSLSGRIAHRDEIAQRELYAGQTYSKKPTRTTLIVAGDSPYDLYVQDALTNEENPWHTIVGYRPTNARIGPPAMHAILVIYVGDQAAAYTPKLNPTMVERFERHHADELADLLQAFGTKTTNPAAFEPYRLRAIAAAATLILRRTGNQREDHERWMKRMGSFDIYTYSHIRRSAALVPMLVSHWNKGLAHESPRRITFEGLT